MNWLFLRGLVREQRHWGNFPEVFAKHFKDFDPQLKVHFLDLPGTGTESASLSPLTVAGIRADLRRRWLDLKKQNQEPWGLLTISLGSMVGLDWCASFPDDLRLLVVINSSAGNLNLPWERLRPSVFPKILRVVAQRDALTKESAILAMTTQLLPDTEALARQWSMFSANRRKLAFTAARQLLAATRFCSPDRVAVPTLLLSGGQDAFTNPRCSINLAARLQIPHEVHPNAGHDLPLDDPTWVSERVLAFLQLL